MASLSAGLGGPAFLTLDAPHLQSRPGGSSQPAGLSSHLALGSFNIFLTNVVGSILIWDYLINRTGKNSPLFEKKQLIRP